MLRTQLMTLLALATFSAAALGQSPLLTLSPPGHGPRGGWQITLTNNYSAAVTAYALDVHAGPTDSHPGLLLGRKVVDSVPGPAQDRIRLGPGQSLTVQFGGAAWPGPLFSDSAVLYADGTTAGDHAIVAHLLRVRQAEAADIGQALPLLDAAGADPQLAENLPSLIAEFAARAKAQSAALGDGVLRHTPDRVCQSVVMTLQNEAGRETPGQAIEALRIMLSRWLNQLRASKPEINTGLTP